jgi:hypothetical protein
MYWRVSSSVDALAGTLEDITQRIQALEKLPESELSRPTPQAGRASAALGAAFPPGLYARTTNS